MYFKNKFWILSFFYCEVLWYVEIIEYIIARLSYSLVRTLHYLIIIIMQTYMYIWRYWTSKMLVRYISVSSVCIRSSQFSGLSFMQYTGLCVFRLPISLMIIVRICALYLIIIKSEVSPICHCLGLGHETMYTLYVFLCSYSFKWTSLLTSFNQHLINT